MFDALSNKLQETLQKIRGQDKITELNVEATLTEIRRELLESDVSLKAVKLFTQRVKEAALGEKVLTGIKPGEQLIKIIYDALVERLGGSIESNLNIEAKPSSILLLGLQGAGKTTTAAKLAYKYKSKKPLLVPCDLQRPAAVLQLRVLAKQAQIDFLEIASDSGTYTVSSPIQLAELALKQASENQNDLIIFDTAGRLQVDTDLMAELLLLEKQIKPQEKLLVIDSLIGQEAANVAETFDTQIGITGIVLTKLDSDTRGGAALSVVEATNQPIKLAAIGEKFEDLENFYPDRMASRILGMGDMLTLVEKVEEKIQEEESKKLEEEIMKGNFNYETFLKMQEMMSRLGSFTSIFKMMGMGQMLSQFGLQGVNQDSLLEQGQNKMSKFKIAINSMSKEEKRKPELLSNASTARSRKTRIAKGSGLETSDLDKLTAEFSRMSKVFKNLGPMMGMLSTDQKTTSPKAINPMEMLSQVSGGLSKKQKQALNQMGALSQVSKGAKPIPKGVKPSVKGFRD